MPCCWTIKCGPNNKKPTQRILFSALLYGNCRLWNFVFTGNMVIFVLILQYGRKMICFKLNNLKFSRPCCSFFWVLNLAPLDKDYFKTIFAIYLSWLSIIPEFHHSVQLWSSKLEIVIIWFLWKKKLQSCKLLMKKNIEMTVEIKFSGTSYVTDWLLLMVNLDVWGYIETLHCCWVPLPPLQTHSFSFLVV